MKPFQFGATSSASGALRYGSVLEKIEILRSRLRWAKHLESDDIAKLLRQCNELRSEVLGLTRTDKQIEEAPLEALTNGTRGARKTPVAVLPSQRRQALVERDFVFEGVFGESPKLLEALEIAEKAAPTELPVLIHGESGTGKELMAKVIHNNGSQSGGPFISVNCGAIPDNLLESELFGHKKGAFTGASGDRKGKFESANNGTIFLDEIGELPLTGQVKLLRVLQSQEIQRVGSDQPIQVNARIVAATNRDLLAMVKQGTFREDLYYRLGVIEVPLPPLRERRDEIPLLIDFFCHEAAEKLNREPLQMAPALNRFLLNYAFPGNVRELHNLIFRMSCLADTTADLSHLPASVNKADAALIATPAVNGTGNSCGDNPELIDKRSLSEMKKTASNAAERRFLEQGLTETHGRVVDLARRIGMNRSHLQTLMKKHGLSARDFRLKQ